MAPRLRKRPSLEDQNDTAELPQVLPTVWRYDYAKTDDDTYEWNEFREPNDIANIIPDPAFDKSTRARVLLLEGLTEKKVATCCSQFGIPEDFFGHHDSESARLRVVDTPSNKHWLSAKWSRLVNQSARHWDIEKKIVQGFPYNVETSKDPERLRLDHERYERLPSLCRPYCLISQKSEEILQHAARETISIAWTHDEPGLFVLVVVDPMREHSINDKRYKIWSTKPEESCRIESCFLNEISSYGRTRFVEELKKSAEPTQLPEFVDRIKGIITQILVSDTKQVLFSLHDALDSIDLSLSKDDILRNSLHAWREHFGHWRQDLLHSFFSVKNMLQAFENQKSCSTCAPQPFPSAMPECETQLVGLKVDLEEALARLYTTFQTVMSTMSIVESQKAILEAETVSKLTTLAFFFIPLSFVASFFGMNVIEFEHQLHIWMWATVSGSIMVLSYSLLYVGKITAAVRSTPQFFLSLNSRRMSGLAMRWSRILVFEVSPWLGVLLIIFGIFAGMGVGLWKFNTADFSTGEKVGISLGIIFGVLLVVIGYVIISRYRGRRRRIRRGFK